MALQPQQLSIALGKGIDTKTDPKQVIAGKLLSLQNGRLGTLSEIKKRNGYAQNGSTLTNGNFSSDFKNELIVGSQNNIYSLDNATNTFLLKGSKVAVDLSTSSIVKNSFSQTIPDYAVNGNLSIFGYEDSNGGVRYTVVDINTGQEIIANTLVTATATIPRCVSIGNYLVLFYLDGGSLKYIAITVPSASVGSPQVVATASGVYDVVVSGTMAYVVFGIPGTVSGITLSSTLILGSPVTIVSQTITAASVFVAGANLGLALIYNSGNNVTMYSLSTAFSVLSTTSVATSSTNQFIRIAGVYNGSVLQAFYESVSPYFSTVNDDTYNNFINFYNGSSSAYFLGSVGLASKAFLNSADSNVYVMTAHDSLEQSQYFLVDSSANIVAKIAAPGNGGGLPAKNILPSVYLNGNTVQAPYQLKELLGAVSGAIFTESGISLASFSFHNSLITGLLGSNLLISGGIMSMYDGINVVEQNYHLFPEKLNSDTAIAGSGLGLVDIRGGLNTGQLTNNATYSYIATYEWTDGQGQVHRSAPSDAVELKAIGGNIEWNANSDGSNPYANARFNGDGNPNNFGITPQVYSQIYNQPMVSGSGVVGGFPVGSYVYDYSFPTPGQLRMSVSQNSNAITAYQSTTPSLSNQTNDLAPFGNSFVLPFLIQANFAVVLGGVYGNGFLTFPATVSQYIYVGDVIIDNILKTVFVVTAVSGTTVSVNGSFPNPAPRASSFSFFPEIQLVATNGSATASIAPGFEYQIPRVYSGQQIVDGGGNFYRISNLGVMGVGTFQLYADTYNSISNGTLKNWATTSTGPGGVNIECTIPPDYLIVKGSKITSSAGGAGINQAWTGDAVVTNVANAGGVVTYTVDQTFSGTSGGDNLYFTIIGVVNFASNFITVPTLRLTNKQNVRIVVYRTAANGSIYYRCTDIQNPIINDKTVQYAIFQDILSDVELVGNDQLYTTGGVVDNNSTPAIGIMTTFKNRPIAVPSENPLSWWYGKEVVPGSPVEFSQFFTENIDARGGNIVAVQAMDDKLVFFKKNNIFYVAGSGPAPTGTQNDFTEAQLVSSDCGCVDKKSVVLMPDGLMFKSTKGIYLLSRNLEVKYIGDMVEQYNSSTITSAVLLESVNEVRFTTNSGIALVYDYYVKQWYTDGNIAALDACIYNSLYTFITSGGVVNTETPGVFTDNAAFIPLSLKTSWLSFAGVQAFQRVWKLLVLGEYKSPHTLAINIRVNFDPAIVQVITIPVGSTVVPYEFREWMKVQKCTSLQIEIIESQTAPYGEGLSLSNLALEFGIKKGLNKLPAGSSF